MAFIALSHISQYCEIEQKLYLKEIKEIIKYHQEHHNLTQLAYQCAWQFLIKRFNNDKSLEEVITNELYFAREAAKEQKELVKSVDFKRKEDERGKETKEELALSRWIDVIVNFLSWFKLRNEELAGLISSIVQVFRESRDNYPDTSNECIISLRHAARNRNVKIDTFAREGVIILFSEEMKQASLNDEIMWNCLLFFLNITEKLKKEEDDELEEEERKESKKKVLEKMEEEGYEEIILSFYERFDFLRKKYYCDDLSLNISDYFAFV